jgi:microcystin degradation protein MlrC
MEDAEGDWMTAVRDVVGPDCLIAASYDLHGNVSERVIAGLDILTAYRTAPHTDVDATRARAFNLLTHCLHDNIQPVCEFVPIPMLLPGEMAMTTAEPTQRLYAGLPQVVAQYNLLDASYLVGYAWADEPRVGASAVAIGLDTYNVRRSLQALATDWWEQRTSFRFGMTTGDTNACIRMAQAAVQHGAPVFISDASDNITGGGVGDVPFVLSGMLDANLQNAVYASIVDAEAIETCLAAGVGSDVTVPLGGKLDTAHGTPLWVTGTVVRFNKHNPLNVMVVLQLGGVQVVVTQRRTAFTTLEQFQDLGIGLSSCEVVGIKLGYLFPELQQIAKQAFLAFSPGAINPDVHQLPYQRLTRPIYPLDGDMKWEPDVHLKTQ